jgi:hypothetical protein
MLAIVVAFVVAGALGSLTDWLFMGVLFHDAYNRYPEVWRPGIRDGADKSAIIASSALGFLMTGAMIGLCALAGVHSIPGGVAVGALSWLAGPPVVIVVNGLFMKVDPRITLAQCLGYAARLVLAGLAAGMALGSKPGH